MESQEICIRLTPAQIERIAGHLQRIAGYMREIIAPIEAYTQIERPEGSPTLVEEKKRLMV